MDNKEIKYNRNELGTQNFNSIDKFVFWSWGTGIIFILGCLFAAIWVPFSPFMINLVFSVALLVFLDSIYMRMVWIDPNRTYDITYREEYSKIIEDEDLDN